MFLNKIRNIFCVPDTKFVSATNVACAGKRGNICVGNNVSATLCPRLPGPLVKVSCFLQLQGTFDGYCTNTCFVSFSEVLMADTDNSSIVEEDEAQLELQLALQR